MNRSLIFLAGMLLSGGGCAGSAAVRGDKNLPVRNVVLYRSGVGYFERSGKFSGEAVEFHVKQSEVGDFLASLTAVERGQGGVRSVSFEVPEVAKPAPVQPPPSERFAPPVPPAVPSTPEDLDVDVKIAFTGDREHELQIAYVVGSPVWRPSYRAVFDGSGKALLQAWAVVQNTSGEDWREVKLSLTTGAPISFRSDLGTPITPQRPLVSDRGEVVDYVPTGETVLEQRASAGPTPMPQAQSAAAPSLSAQPEQRELAADEAEMADFSSGGAAMKKEALKSRSRVRAAPPAPPPPMDAQSMARTESQATASVLSESVTQYNLSQPVTIPNGGSTMVVISSTRVSGEQAHLYAPEGGVPLSSQHPFAVARLHNDTGFVLERGPISVLANGAFLGQGIVDTLPREAQAFVPFSIDKSLVVEPNEQWSEEEGTLVQVQRGYLTVRRFSQRKTVYRLRNGGATATKMYVRHNRWSQAELLTPPAGTELAPDKALVPIAVPAYGKVELAIIERTPVELTLSIMDPRAAEAVTLYLSGPAANDPQSAELKRALALRTELGQLDAQIAAAEAEQREVNQGLDETRQNLKAIEKLASAKDLRVRLYERLKQLDARGGQLTTQLIEARTRHAELQVRLNEALDHVTLARQP
ncbi:MAG: uncharacterized protein JWN48_4529 [Myxococcaceae bacterium]|nr:uncharacterized protein [Myxococcaceae bacterium]